MKTDSEILIGEWSATRDKLLDTYVSCTGETNYSGVFVEFVRDLSTGFLGLKGGLNLKLMNPCLLGSDFLIFAEIQAMYRFIELLPCVVYDVEGRAGFEIIIGEKLFWRVNDAKSQR